MNAKRFNLIMIGIIIALVAGCVGITIYASTWLKERSKNIISTKLDTISLEEKQKNYQKTQAILTDNQETIAMLDKITPKSKDQARAIAELLKIADEAGASINSIAFPASDLGVIKTTPKTESTDKSSSSQSTPAAATSPITQAKPVDGLPGIYGIEVTLSQIDRKGSAYGSGITYDQLLQILQGIERNRRAMQTKLVQIQPPASPGKGYVLTITLTIYVKP